jgi:phosphatidylserine/phosphatidylglycerophosphate/cardiolipin synthase-like enzyme
MPTQFETDNVPRFFPVQGYTIPWPRWGSKATEGDAVPQMNKAADLAGHRVTTFITGKKYFEALFDEINALLQSPQGGIFWVHGWFFDLFVYEAAMRFSGTAHLPAALQTGEPGQYWHVYRQGTGLMDEQTQDMLWEKIVELENNNVDVRIIGYVSPIFLQSYGLVKASEGFDATKSKDIGGIKHESPTNVHDRGFATFYNLLRLRAEMSEPERVVFNTLSHPLGGAHAKMVIIGNSNYRKVFTGGIDMAADRHSADNHDVAVCVEGKATTFAARFFKDLWNEIRLNQAVQINFEGTEIANQVTDFPAGNYASHLGASMTMDIADIAPVTTGTTADKHVQMYTTLPRKHYANSAPSLRTAIIGATLSSKLGISLSQGRDYVRGLRDFKQFYTPKISFAEKGRFEFKTACYKAIDEAEGYIFIIDQAASNYELMTRINKRVREQLDAGFLLRVVIGTPFLTMKTSRNLALTKQEVITIAARQSELFKRLSDSIPEREHEDLFIFAMVSTHAKVMLIDDKWAAIGSANCMRRSFYTDIEMGFSILHETWVEDFRKALFASFLDPSSDPIPDDPFEALAIWGLAWRDGYLNTDFSKFLFNPNLFYTAQTPTTRTKDSFDSTRYEFDDPDSNNII